jgi:hypothetical protein
MKSYAKLTQIKLPEYIEINTLKTVRIEEHGRVERLVYQEAPLRIVSAKSNHK